MPDALARLPELEQPPDAVLLDVPAPVGLSAPGQLEPALPAARIVAVNVPDHRRGGGDRVGRGGRERPARPRDVDVDEVAQAVETTAPGGTVCSPKLAAVLLRRVARDAEQRPAAAPLTAREREIAALIEQGLSNKEIAGRLQIELPTVKNHVHNILTKLKATRRGQAAAMLCDDALNRFSPRRGRL